MDLAGSVVSAPLLHVAGSMSGAHFSSRDRYPVRFVGRGRGAPARTRKAVSRVPREEDMSKGGVRFVLRATLSLAGAVVLLLALAGVSHATVNVSRAEVSGSQLRIEGTAAPNRTITVDGVAMGTSDGSGRFRVERSGFTPPADCTVDVNDGSASAATARLSGCTVSSPPPPPSPPPSTEPPPPGQVAVASLTLSQTTVVGGNTIPGTVSLSAAAPSGGFVVSLSSSNPGLAQVAPSVTVPAGQTSAGFSVSTVQVDDTRSATITGTGGGASRSATLTVVPQSPDQRGSISLARGCVGPCGGGLVTSQPAGVNCTITPTSTSGACNNVFFPAGTRVRLEARPDASSRFQGWEFEVSCRNAPEVTIQAGIAHICRPVFSRR